MYCDIKFGNVCIMDENCVKIMDFGIVKIVSVEFQLMQIGMIFGMLVYLLFEQLCGDLVDQCLDIYFFGVFVFEFLIYCRMFEVEMIFVFFFQIFYQDLFNVVSVWKECLKMIDDIIGCCVVKELNDCYLSFCEVIFDLQLLIEYYEVNFLDLLQEQLVFVVKLEDQVSIVEGECQVVVMCVCDQIEDFLIFGDFKQVV